MQQVRRVNDDTVNKLLSVTRGESCDDPSWSAITREVLEDLRAYLGEGFEVDPEPFYDAEGFGIWLFDERPRKDPVVWSAVLSGRAIDPGYFDICLSQFLFDRASQTRKRNSKGSVVVHGLPVKECAVPRWQSFGWQEDDYEEWEDVPNPVED